MDVPQLSEESLEDVDDDSNSSYILWKRWSAENFGVCSDRLARYFDAEIRRIGPNNIESVVEIGFGNGEFLAYARRKGWNITGTEANDQLVALASQNGFTALASGAIDSLKDNSLDLVVAFDVLEHLSADEIIMNLTIMRRKLKEGGRLLARVPNGDSLLGLPHQNGDVTHRSAIGTLKVRQLAELTSFELFFVKPTARPIIWSYIPRLRSMVANAITFIVGRLLEFLYFSGEGVCLFTPNIVFVLRKSHH